MRQYMELKNRYPDAILMFRMGDFYEMFFEDAVLVGPILDITVTSRDKNAADPVPMAGVPYHAVGGYLRTLVERGLKVAICEQMESPEEARKRKGPHKIVRRDVVRVVTPGALLDEEHLESGQSNYFVVLKPSLEGTIEGASLAALDISCGELIMTTLSDGHALKSDLARLAAKQILTPKSLHDWLRSELGTRCPMIEDLVDAIGASSDQIERVRLICRDTGGIDGVTDGELETAAIALTYAEHTQPGQTLLLHRIRHVESSQHLRIDATSLRNLEIFRTLRDGQREGSLLWIVDATRTAMGARMIRQWLGAPLGNIQSIEERQAGIAALLDNRKIRDRIQSQLKDVRDIVRLAARARLQTINPRELGALRDSLGMVPKIIQSIKKLSQVDSVPKILNIAKDRLTDVYDPLNKYLIDQPPSIAREGGFIREGADVNLDKQRSLCDGGKNALAAIESRERDRTGIPGLKVQHNRVFGYFIEIPKAHLKKVPSDFVRKQTLANAERFVTEELAEHESKVLGAQAKALERELALFGELRNIVSDAAERICEIGEQLANLDVIAGLAEIAEKNNYCRPLLVEQRKIAIEDGRHPVVEKMLRAGQFVPNSIALDGNASNNVPRLLIVTGPNMGGKSTIMRQIALIVLLAHVGSYVPAQSATIGLTDRIFTRAGAADDLGHGDSTFMVEMRETAEILSQASSRSLVLLDEIGRGTATYDGLSLAWAITEYLHDQIHCPTLFASHYHELCALAELLQGVANIHVAVHEQRGKIVFLHRIEPGPAGRSYGIHVGRLAGLPERVLRRANKILKRLESSEAEHHADQLGLFVARTPPPVSVGEPATMNSDSKMVLQEMLDCELDDLSPRQTQELLYQWVARLRESSKDNTSTGLSVSLP